MRLPGARAASIARRLFAALSVVLIWALVASSAQAAAPRYVMVSGPAYHRPVLLDDWLEIHRLLLAIAGSPLASQQVVSRLGSRPSAELGLFWGWGAEPPSHPADAPFTGTFYPKYRGQPAVMRVQVNADDRPRVVGRWVLELLARRGVVVSAGGPTCPVSEPSTTTSGYTYGNGRLRVAMYWDDGVVVAGPTRDGAVYATADRTGTIHQKVGWWRARGVLHIVGRRLDGDRAVLRSRVPEGYGGRGFQPTELLFPTTGCWRVTATAGSGRLSYVVWVSRTAQ